MSDNNEIEQGDEQSSDPELDDLFLSPDESDAEEIAEFTPEETSEVESGPTPQSAPQPEPEPEPAPAPVAAAAPGVSSEVVTELEAERDDYKNRMMRVAADLENFRKRAAREKEDLRKFGIDRVVLELLPVLDNLERALDHGSKVEDSANILDGVRMVHRQFVTALEKHGVKGFSSKGEQFDPQKHEAIQQVDTVEHLTGHVLEEYQKGYYLHERLIRPAMVVVARNTSGVVETATDESEGSGADDAESDVIDVGASAEDHESESSEGADESAVN